MPLGFEFLICISSYIHSKLDCGGSKDLISGEILIITEILVPGEDVKMYIVGDVFSSLLGASVG